MFSTDRSRGASRLRLSNRMLAEGPGLQERPGSAGPPWSGWSQPPESAGRAGASASGDGATGPPATARMHRAASGPGPVSTCARRQAGRISLPALPLACAARRLGGPVVAGCPTRPARPRPWAGFCEPAGATGGAPGRFGLREAAASPTARAPARRAATVNVRTQQAIEVLAVCLHPTDVPPHAPARRPRAQARHAAHRLDCAAPYPRFDAETPVPSAVEV